MTREEAINKLNWALDNNTIEDIQSAYDYIMAIKMAIKALGQEQELILDKIRAEIDEQYDRVHPYNISCAEGLEMALEIIDKYKAESLEQEPCEDVPDINNGNIYECSCGYGWDKTKVVRHHFCPNCGAKVAEGNKE